MIKARMSNDKITFKTTISKMGEKKLVIIPSALHDMLENNGFEGVPVRITIDKVKSRQ